MVAVFPRWAAQGAFYTIHDLGIAAVEHCVEQVAQQPDQVPRQSGRYSALDKAGVGQVHVGYLTAGGLTEYVGDFRQGDGDVHHHVHELTLGVVLGKPAGAHHGPEQPQLG